MALELLLAIYAQTINFKKILFSTNTKKYGEMKTLRIGLGFILLEALDLTEKNKENLEEVLRWKFRIDLNVS